MADPGTTAQLNCIDEDASFKLNGKTPVFFIVIENKCEQRLSCRIDSFVTTAKGVSQGHATLVLAPKSAGAAAKKTYVLRLKEAGGGNAQSSRACHVV